MHGTLPNRIREARDIERTLMQGDARLCRSLFGDVMKLIFPHKTAENLAAEIGGKERACAYELSGEREPSPAALLLIMQKILENYEANRR
jgi:hypothetical protein